MLNKRNWIVSFLYLNPLLFKSRFLFCCKSNLCPPLSILLQHPNHEFSLLEPNGGKIFLSPTALPRDSPHISILLVSVRLPSRPSLFSIHWSTCSLSSVGSWKSRVYNHWKSIIYMFIYSGMQNIYISLYLSRFFSILN